MVKVPRGTTLVSDSWRSTLSAVKLYRHKMGMTTKSLKHELVNHSQGQVVNENGYTTNHIEGRWSTLKRWVRARYGGRLRAASARTTWARAIGSNLDTPYNSTH
eukprot:6475654-Amphidinium_carterae.1